MTTLTKLLSAEAKPAKAILDRAHPLILTSEQRKNWNDTFETSEGKIAVTVEEKRPLYVGDVFLDESGAFWVVRPAVEKVLHVSGDMKTMQEAAAALVNRGVDLAQTEEGFAVLPLPNIAKMLGMIGLEVKEVEAEFDPIRLVRSSQEGGCSCGCGHDHSDGCSCGCGHEHHDDHDCSCGCGHDHHHEGHECSCGHDHGEGEGEHKHQHGHGHGRGKGEGGCGCGGHEHEEKACSCGGHHHDEGSCSCGHDHGEGEGEHKHQHGHGHGRGKGEGGCGCGGHDHEDGACGCGGHHHEDGHSCGCGEDHHHEHGEGCSCGCGHDHHHHEEKHYKY